MAREILFKAKRMDNGEWLEGFVFETNDNSYIAYNGQFDDDLFLSPSNIFIRVDKNTICQYTGLTDKNGKKIWENDVVKKHFYTDYDAYANSEEYVGKVEYLDFAWCITFEENKHKCVYPIFMAVEFKDAEYYEVIGNIFDNPELLNK